MPDFNRFNHFLWETSQGHLLLAAMSIVGALVILAWRVRETQRPVSVKSIVIPPLGMSTGFFMFVNPNFRLPWLWAMGAFLVGALFLAYPLLRSSHLTREGERVMMQRSRAFLAIILGLAAIRIGLHEYLDELLPARQTGALFFVLAFGMISRWRAWMFLEYRKLVAA